jgi:hypothetical protein
MIRRTIVIYTLTASFAVTATLSAEPPAEPSADTEAIPVTDATPEPADATPAPEATPEPASRPEPATLPVSDLRPPPPAATGTAVTRSDTETTASTSSTAPVQESEPAPPGRSLFVLTYSMASSLGNSYDYIPGFSPRGISFGYRFHILPQFAVGLLFAWQTFENKSATTETFNNGTMTIRGTQIRTRSFMPLVATAHYNFKVKSDKVVPFAGIETGAYHVASVEDYPWFYLSDSQWHFGFAPELGLRLANVKFPLYLALKYCLMVPNSEQDTQMMLSYHIGFSWAR